MAQKRPSILNDPRWQRLAVRYRNDIVKFVVEVIGDEPSAQQREVLDASAPKGAWVSVRSGHGTGKSRMMAWVVLHFMLCHVKPNIILTANNINQVRDIVFKYIVESWGGICKRFPWIEPYFVVTSERFYARGMQKQWFVAGRTVPKDKPESIAGFHNKNYLVIVDEASSVSDAVLGVLAGALSEENNKIILLSQPTRNNGHFYDSHHSLKKKNPSDHNEIGYHSIALNSEYSPHVTLKAIRQYIKRYGGTDSPEYQIKVKGEFSDQLEGFLITRRAINKAQQNKVVMPDDWGYVIVADVGGGVERDSSIMGAFRIGGYYEERCIEPIWIREMPGTMAADEFGLHIIEASREFENCSIAVDAIGVGGTTAKVIERKGYNPQKITWGLPCHAQSHKERFFNQRAYCYVALRDAMSEGRARLDKSEKVIDQLSRIPYRLNERGQYQMLGKEQMASQGIPSPDLGDVYAMAQLADYIPCFSAYSGDDDEEDDYLNSIIKAVTGES